MDRFKLFLKTQVRLIIFIVLLIFVATASVIGIMKKNPEKKTKNDVPRTVTIINDDGKTKRMPSFVNTDDSNGSENETGDVTLLAEDTENKDTIVEPSEVTYVLNKSKHKFHLPTCSSVSKIADHNKGEFIGTRDELIADGYEPCKVCNP